MADITLQYTEAEINARLAAVTINTAGIRSLENTTNQHAASISGNSTAIGNLQTDISHVKTRVAALEMSGGGGGSSPGLTIVSMSQAAYDALATKDPDTLYLTY